MKLRKALALGIAVLVSAVIALPNASQASNPTGGPIAAVWVGNLMSGPVRISAAFKSGSHTFGGGTFGCSGGSAGASIERGTGTNPGQITFNSLSLTCASPLGFNATITAQTAGCATAMFLHGTNVHTGLNPSTDVVDTGTGTKVSRVPGTVTAPSNCLRYSALGGLCTAQLSGTAAVFFDELMAPDDTQDLILNGSGLAFSNQTGCLGLISGSVTFNNLALSVATPAGSGIDFR